MTITATIRNNRNENQITVSTDNNKKSISIPAKAEGNGSSVNGGELLYLSLATCFCNDIYREAKKRNIHIEDVEVNVSGNFGKEGEPSSEVLYEVNIISSTTPQNEINDLIQYVDSIAEIHNTLRKGVSVKLKNTLKEI